MKNFPLSNTGLDMSGQHQKIYKLPGAPIEAICKSSDADHSCLEQYLTEGSASCLASGKLLRAGCKVSCLTGARESPRVFVDRLSSMGASREPMVARRREYASLQ